MTIYSSDVSLQKHSHDVDMTAFWLKNACLLHDLLTQHSPKRVRWPCINSIIDWELNLHCCCCSYWIFYFSDPWFRWSGSTDHWCEWLDPCPEWPLYPGLSAAPLHHWKTSAKHHRCHYSEDNTDAFNALPSTPPFVLPPASSLPQSLLCWRARPSQVCLPLR